jgi:hypothetical protein
MAKLLFPTIALVTAALAQPASAEIFNAAELAEMRAFYALHTARIIANPEPGNLAAANLSAKHAALGLACADGAMRRDLD